MTLCDLCLKCDVNTEILDDILREILEVLLSIKIRQKQGLWNVCEDCVSKIKNCFSFKSKCLITEDLLFPYINDGTTHIDLIQIYNAENNIKLCINRSKVCRLCMNVVEKSAAVSLQSTLSELKLQELFREYFKEVDSTATIHSQICSQCIENLQFFKQFVEIYKNNCKLQESQLKGASDLHSLQDNHNAEQDEMSGSNKLKTKQLGTLHDHVKRKYPSIIQCNVCSFKTTSQHNLTRHKNIKHDSNELYKCEHCSFSTKNESSNRKHAKIHKTLKTCEFCKGKYSLTYYKDHVETKHGTPKVHKCKLCPFTSIHNRTLSKHMLIHDNKKAFACTLCDYKSNRSDSLKRHAIKHQTQNVELFECNQCQYKTKYKSSLLTHFISHKRIGRIFTCTICDMEFKYTRDHKVHMLEAHGGLGIYKCEKCPFDSVSKLSLKIHIHKKHGDKPSTKYLVKASDEVLSCDSCSYTCKHTLNMTKHKIINHEGFENSQVT